MTNQENPALRDEDLTMSMMSQLRRAEGGGLSDAFAFFAARAESMERTGIVYTSPDVRELFLNVKRTLGSSK